MPEEIRNCKQVASVFDNHRGFKTSIEQKEKKNNKNKIKNKKRKRRKKEKERKM